MELLTPGVGLIFWTTLFFLLTWAILGKFAFKPMVKMLNDRNKLIEDSIQDAKDAREAKANIERENQKSMAEARSERDKMLRAAKDTQEQIIFEARQKAKEDVSQMISDAQAGIEREKQQAILALKNQIAGFSVDIASKLLEEELKDSKKQQAMLDKMIGEIHLS